MKTLMPGEKRLPEYMEGIHDILCGCGDHTPVWEAVVWELDRCGTRFSTGNRSDLETGRQELIAHLLCHLELTEHGSSVYGGWLTEKGIDVLGFLKSHGADWEEKADWVTKDDVHVT